jgi:DNA-directed RNA polymerase III subunit RPC4
MPPRKPPARPSARPAAVKAEPQSETPAQEPGQASAGAEAPISVDSTPQATPAATPAGTPAGTPAPGNPAVQRAGTAGLDGSSTPAARGRPAVAKPKFAGRRSQKSRAELEKEEAERRKEENDKKAKEDQRNRRKDAARGRGAFRGRQRGGYMGESERKVPDAPIMSGPFSLGQVSSDSSAARRSAPGWAARSGGGGGGGASGSGGGGGGFKQENGSRGYISDVMMGDGANIKPEDGGYISSDDEEEEENKGMQKRDVDDLRVVDLTLEGSAPVRVQRVEHKERTLGLNADGIATKDGSAAKAQARDGPATLPDDKKKGKQRAKDVEITGEQHKFKGTYSESSSEQGDEPQIKEEPTDDARPMTPEPAEGAAGAAAVPDILLQSPVSSPETRRKNKDRIKISGERPDFQTNEEQTEWELHQKDLRILHHELGRLAVKDQDGDAAMQGADAQPAQDDPRADKVYLFQFPPILPDLIHKTIKPDPETAEGAEGAAAPANASNQLQSTDPEPSGNTHTFNPGRVGKMRIHKSGRATLDWGGTPMEIGMGSEASFLQDVLIANFNKNEENKVESGTAMGMGQVKGKFIVTPDWNEILG